jgi:hypothetical protein
MTVECCQLVPDRVEVQQSVGPVQQMNLWDVILDPKPIVQVLQRLQPSHHHLILPVDTASESAGWASIKAGVIH